LVDPEILEIQVQVVSLIDSDLIILVAKILCFEGTGIEDFNTINSGRKEVYLCRSKRLIERFMEDTE